MDLSLSEKRAQAGSNSSWLVENSISHVDVILQHQPTSAPHVWAA
jgi:hypothetical protein